MAQSVFETKIDINRTDVKPKKKNNNKNKQNKDNDFLGVFLRAIQFKLTPCYEIYSQLYTLYMYLLNTHNCNNKKRDRINTSII